MKTLYISEVGTAQSKSQNCASAWSMAMYIFRSMRYPSYGVIQNPSGAKSLSSAVSYKS